jgi:NADH-quinone oxidoreductase subunit F
MLQDKDRIFTNVYGFQPWNLPAALKRGDWDNTKALMALGQDTIIDRIKASGLRGRGGAGFPTGTKWSFMPKEPRPDRPNFLVINADESEPGSCKDREIIRHDPHKLIEGALIAGFAMRARAAYIYIRGEYIREAETLFAAVPRPMTRACSARTPRARAMISTSSSIAAPARTSAAKRPRCSRASRARRASRGSSRRSRRARVSMAARPRSTMSNRSRWSRRSCGAGPNGSRRFGAENNKGTKLFQISGHVNKPVVVEEAMSIPFRELIEKHCGGIRGGWDNLLAVIPGGSSVPLVPAAQIMDCPMDFDGLQGRRLGPRHRGRDRHGQVDRHRPRDQPPRISTSMRAAASARRAARAPAGCGA